MNVPLLVLVALALVVPVAAAGCPQHGLPDCYVTPEYGSVATLPDGTEVWAPKPGVECTNLW